MPGQARAIAQAAQTCYAELGASDHFRAIPFPGGHGFPATQRTEAYAFLDHGLA